MEKLIRGLHHVTATVTDAQADLDFYAKLLGLRLVKKTVNFDNHTVFHFYYGNGTGTPSTLMTTFLYKGWGVPAGRQGAGQITVTSFSVPDTSLPYWRSRLAAASAPVREDATPFDEPALELLDPSGLRIRLVSAAVDAREPWVTPDVGADVAIRGLHSVTLSIRRPAPSLAFLTEVLGFAVINEAEGVTRVGIGAGLPGQVIEIADAAGDPDGVNGLGTVHHVAFAISDAEEQLRIREALLRIGVQVTEVRDRQYFTSIYFREPGGVLYEIATLGPGFMVDEAPDGLGQALKLPPWEERHRAAIEAGLPPIAR